mmetsp:Transcript_67013/g.111366  ORF Transcript_67013/g.111366 Transcript_67013/m.111366 type:complete len:441 (+) Transcript_67013:82-1404(+)
MPLLRSFLCLVCLSISLAARPDGRPAGGSACHEPWCSAQPGLWKVKCSFDQCNTCSQCSSDALDAHPAGHGRRRAGSAGPAYTASLDGSAGPEFTASLDGQRTYHSPWSWPADWSLTELVNGDSRRPVLFMIDVQLPLLAFKGQAALHEVSGGLLRLLRLFRSRCWPIIWKIWNVGPEGSGMARFYKNRFHRMWDEQCTPVLPHPTFGPTNQEEAGRTFKSWHFDNFYDNPRLLELLRSWRVNTVVVAGTFTEHCIDTTARQAFEHNFDVVVPIDAVGPGIKHGGAHREALLSLSAAVALLTNSTRIEEAWRHSLPAMHVCPQRSGHEIPSNSFSASESSFPIAESFCRPLPGAPWMAIAPPMLELSYQPKWNPPEASPACSQWLVHAIHNSSYWNRRDLSADWLSPCVAQPELLRTPWGIEYARVVRDRLADAFLPLGR